MKKWEYKVCHISPEVANYEGDGDFNAEVCGTYEKQLNKLGADGWELTGQAADGGLIFKRPVKKG